KHKEALTRKLTKKVRELEQERKALRVEIQKNALILASAGEGIFGLDKDGKITFINPAAISMSEYSEQELTTLYGHSFWHHKHPNNTEYQELECPVCITLQAGHAWSGESYFIRKNGSSLPIHCICQPVVEEGMETSLVVSFMDITEKKLLVKDLINAKEKAEESNRLKSAFLANMNHEIRTPMNGIMGFVDLLQTPELSDEQKNLFTTILTKSCDRLLDTINDIIEISKIESQQPTVHYSEVDINELMDYLLEFFMPEAENKRLIFSMSAELQGEAAKINTDKIKLESILINLVQNALKFTSQGFIRFGYQLHDDTLIFSVKDSGIGIPKNKQKAIFNQFEQADLTFTKPHEGSGLGLTIAKAYAEMLGGKIQVESEIGKGSTFYFSVNYSPVQQKAKEAIDETVLQDNKLTGSLILIAEDDINSFFYFQTILSREKVELLHALNGEDAIKLCKNNPGISLILMDIKMPKMDGYEATRKIREFNKDVSIIAQTAYALHGDREKALEAGCDDYIVKPIKKDDLKKMISKHLING
ncbi:MAG: response regulator, partial [Bacteroidetes bacterium]|nr:response regulator [Bacteroidota bacterium]